MLKREGWSTDVESAGRPVLTVAWIVHREASVDRSIGSRSTDACPSCFLAEFELWLLLLSWYMLCYIRGWYLLCYIRVGLEPSPVNLVPWVLETRVFPMLLTLKADGASISYQSFLAKGSTLEAWAARRRRWVIWGMGCRWRREKERGKRLWSKSSAKKP